MATRKLKVLNNDGTASNYDQIKDEIVALLTGREVGSRDDINYATLITRVSLLLIVVYGVGRIGVLRQLAISIATTVLTKWIAEKAKNAMATQPAMQTF